MHYRSLTAPSLINLERQFKEWLHILGYSEQTVYSMPRCIHELLLYLEQSGIMLSSQINCSEINDYYNHYLRHRPNLRSGGKLSADHLNKHIQALGKLCDFLTHTEITGILRLNIPSEERLRRMPAVLTEMEIQQLFAACDMNRVTAGRKPEWLNKALILRDKALLSIFYGCGLRRNEGVLLNVSDILMDKEVLHVRYGKNYRERLVPLSRSVFRHMVKYLDEARPALLKYQGEEALFLTERGLRMQGQMMLIRFHALVIRTANHALINKEPGLHSLRHSIATHLLSHGMKLERIRDFLGHNSLESTQIYTHLIEDGQMLT